MTAPGSSLTFSMYRDLRKGAPVEADHILGDFIERGSAHGVATPLLKAAFVNLRIYQNRVPKDKASRAPIRVLRRQFFEAFGQGPLISILDRFYLGVVA